jgi:hypothetical protein
MVREDFQDPFQFSFRSGFGADAAAPSSQSRIVLQRILVCAAFTRRSALLGEELIGDEWTKSMLVCSVAATCAGEAQWHVLYRIWWKVLKAELPDKSRGNQCDVICL